MADRAARAASTASIAAAPTKRAATAPQEAQHRDRQRWQGGAPRHVSERGARGLRRFWQHSRDLPQATLAPCTD